MELRIRKPHLNLPTIGNRNTILTLIKKELFVYFSTPLAYIILALFMIIVAVLLFGMARYAEFGTADLSTMFAYISFAFVIIIPALTMGSISKEKQSGTIEYILTQPLTELQFLVAKFLAYAGLILVMLLLTLPLTLFVGSFAQLDFGQVVMQYVGALILGLCLLAVGLAVSSMLKNEIAAFLTTLVISTLLIVLGSELLRFSFGLDFIIERLGLLSHYQSISRGVVDLRDVLYFVAFIAAFLLIAYYFVIRDKYPKKHDYLRNSKLALVIGIVATILIGYIGQVIPGRIDFTSNKIYTLSDSSVKVINQVNDVLKLDFYASSNLPTEFQAEVRNVQDLLRDYSSYSAGKISYEVKQPDRSEETTKEAESSGIEPIRFQVNASDTSQTTVGYFGIVISYLDQKEIVNLNSEEIINNLEYQLTKKLRKLTNTSPTKVAFVSENVGFTRGAEMQTFATELAELFELIDITLEDPIGEDIGVIVLASPNANFSDAALANLKNFYTNGGSILLLANTINVSQESQIPQVNPDSMKDFFADAGVTVAENLVYDLTNNNLVNVGYFFPLNYPLWVIPSAADGEASILKDVKTTSMLWVSSLGVDETKFGANIVKPLLQTSSASNAQPSDALNLSFDQAWDEQSTDTPQIVAVSIENPNEGRAVVTGDAKFLTDQYEGLVGLEDNLAFGISSIEWLAKEDSIATIKAKVRTASRLNLTQSQTTLLTVGSVAIPLGVLLALGSFKYLQRRRKVNKEYTLDD